MPRMNHVYLIVSFTLISVQGTSSFMKSTVSELVNCELEMKSILQNPPPTGHKLPPKNPHSRNYPLLAVGYHMWVNMQCSCCCGIQKQLLLQTMHKKLQTNSSQKSGNVTEVPIWLPEDLAYEILLKKAKVISLSRARTKTECLSGGSSSGDGKRRRVRVIRELTRSECKHSKCPLLISVECRQHHVMLKSNNNATVNQSFVIEPKGFCLSADHLGYEDVKVNLVWINASGHLSGSGDNQTIKREVTSNSPSSRGTIWIANAHIKNTAISPAYTSNESSSVVSAVTDEKKWTDSIHVTVVLPPQTFYAAADWSTVIITCMIAFSVGCCSDPIVLRAYLKRFEPIVVGVVCQLLIIPAISLAIGAGFSLNTDQAFGLFVTATVPGGGLAYLFTYLAKGDRHMSAALSLVISLVDIAIAASWMLIVGRYWFGRPLCIGIVIGWLSMIAAAQLIGISVRACHPGLANGLLTWVTRPLLLLWGILLVTLGVYINHYAYAELNRRLTISVLLLIISGFTIAWSVNRFFKRSVDVTKAMATEASVFNGLLCMPLLRTSLYSPDGDLAAVVALVATFLAPTPLVLNAIGTVLQRWLNEYLQRRKKLQEQRQNSLLPGLMRGGGNVGDMCTTSVVAVAAAAIAVAPAITGTREGGHRKDAQQRLLSPARSDPSSSSSGGGEQRKQASSPVEEDSTQSTVVTSNGNGGSVFGRQYNTTDNPTITNAPVPVCASSVTSRMNDRSPPDSGVNPLDRNFRNRQQAVGTRKDGGNIDGRNSQAKLVTKETGKLKNHRHSLSRSPNKPDQSITTTKVARSPVGLWYEGPPVTTTTTKPEQLVMLPIPVATSDFQGITEHGTTYDMDWAGKKHLGGGTADYKHFAHSGKSSQNQEQPPYTNL